MNKEIKEILEIFKQVDLEPEAGGCYNCPKKDKDKTCIGCLNNAKDKLLDYITNLQQENKRLKEKNKMLQEDAWRNNANLMEMVKEELEKTDCEECEIYEDYKSRIEKAVEYIEPFVEFDTDIMFKGKMIAPVLDILRGDKE